MCPTTEIGYKKNRGSLKGGRRSYRRIETTDEEVSDSDEIDELDIITLPGIMAIDEDGPLAGPSGTKHDSDVSECEDSVVLDNLIDPQVSDISSEDKEHTQHLRADHANLFVSSDSGPPVPSTDIQRPSAPTPAADVAEVLREMTPKPTEDRSASHHVRSSLSSSPSPSQAPDPIPAPTFLSHPFSLLAPSPDLLRSSSSSTTDEILVNMMQMQHAYFERILGALERLENK